MKTLFKARLALLLCAALLSGSASPAAAQMVEFAAEGGGVSLGPIIIGRTDAAQSQNPLQEKLSSALPVSASAETGARAAVAGTRLQATPSARRARLPSAKPGDFQALKAVGKAIEKGSSEKIDALFYGGIRARGIDAEVAAPAGSANAAAKTKDGLASLEKPGPKLARAEKIPAARSPILKSAPRPWTRRLLRIGGISLLNALMILSGCRSDISRDDSSLKPGPDTRNAEIGELPYAPAWHPVAPAHPELAGRFLTLDKAIAEGADYLMKQQGEDGSWGNGKDGYRWFDNSHVRVPITAMALDALETARPPEAEKAIEKGAAYVFGMMLQSRNYLKAQHEIFGGNNFKPYALAYGLSALLKQYPRVQGEAQARYKSAIEAALREIADSSWVYGIMEEYPSTFELALLAHSLQQTQAAGFALPRRPRGKDSILEAILDALESSRIVSGGFPYYVGGYPEDEKNTAARDPLIELVLYKAQRSKLGRLRAAVDRFFKSQGEMEKILAENDGKDSQSYHEHPHRWAKYFYLFGLYWTAEALKELPPGQDRTELAQRLADAVLRLRKDGKWVDSPTLTGPNYGAASAVLILRTARELIDSRN